MNLNNVLRKAPGIAAALLPLATSAFAGNQARPNVLFIAVDDLKPNLGCFGDTTAISPNIDKLATRGVVFANNQCQWAVSGPTRASLMTGLTPQNTGVQGFQFMRNKNPDVVTLPQYFKANGYFTAATGKIYDPRCVGTRMDPKTKQGVDGKEVDDPQSWSIPYVETNYKDTYKESKASAFDGKGTNYPDYIDYRVGSAGVELLEQAAKTGKPFFVGVGFKKPHLPFVAPKQFWDLYKDKTMPIARFQEHPEGAVEYSWNNAQELRKEYGDSPKEGPIPLEYQKNLLQGYYACVSMVDDQVGRLIAELDKLGLRENTIIILWGDHGFHLGDHGDWGKHTNMENAARAPMIIVDPRESTHYTTHNPSAFLDIYPTLCDMAGLEIPENLDGISIRSMLQDENARPRQAAVTMFSRNGANGYAVRDNRYRYVEWVKKGEIVAKELYDYQVDPLETINYAVNHPEMESVMNEMAQKLRAQKVWDIK